MPLGFRKKEAKCAPFLGPQDNPNLGKEKSLDEKADARGACVGNCDFVI